MRYGPPKVAAADIAGFVETRNRRFKVLRQEPEFKQSELMSFGEMLLFYAGHRSQRRSHGGEIHGLNEAFGEGEPLSLEVSMPDFPSVTAVRWEVPEALTLLLAENDDTEVMIGTLGFEDQEFVSVVSDARRIDGDLEVLAWHDEIFARRLREIEEQWR